LDFESVRSSTTYHSRRHAILRYTEVVVRAALVRTPSAKCWRTLRCVGRHLKAPFAQPSKEICQLSGCYRGLVEDKWLEGRRERRKDEVDGMF
jgi:ribosome modulation factor